MGVFQPLLDGIKLLKKEQLIVLGSEGFKFISLPFVSFILILVEWSLFLYSFTVSHLSCRFLLFLVMLGCGVYPLVIAGGVSKRKYAILGAIRASSQTVSFEIVFSFILLMIMVGLKGFGLNPLFNCFIFLFLPLFLFTLLVELNRAPFDFAEGERELIRGYNVEYGRVGFVLFFLKEYGSLLFFSALLSLLYFYLSLTLIFVTISLFLWFRRSFPRYRYDLLIAVFWFTILPVRVNFMLAGVVFLV